METLENMERETSGTGLTVNTKKRSGKLVLTAV
jgi:hypothetical protein